MTIEQMTPEEEVRLRLAAGISPSTPTEYMLRHIPLWVKMSILRVVSPKPPIESEYTFRVLSTIPTVYRITESGAYRVME